MQENKLAKENLIIAFSTALLFISTYLFMTKELTNDNTINNLTIESINIKNISVAKVTYKNGTSDADINQISPVENSSTSILEKTASATGPAQQLSLTSAVKWQLPTKTGQITSYPSYYHVAYDITSPNGIYETIYPVASGTITGIYNDSAGAKIVTIHHYIDGIDYTSQYVHLSSYANDLYVGKTVTMNDPIGQMGSTGIATGVHLHITVVDNCILFDPNDANCKDLNSFFKYIAVRYNQGFKGLSNLITVPNSW